ncbi:MAG: hypothetical protein J6V52_02875 [Bacteroidaceae bacterium]|nr:hypothetical protein [Bacteroidaceae bacterium]
MTILFGMKKNGIPMRKNGTFRQGEGIFCVLEAVFFRAVPPPLQKLWAHKFVFPVHQGWIFMRQRYVLARQKYKNRVQEYQKSAVFGSKKAVLQRIAHPQIYRNT